jgi:hypothetical protein
MVYASSAEFATGRIGSGQAKVCNGDSSAPFETHDVFRLEIAMEDARVVTVLDAVDELQEDVPNCLISGQVPALVEDLVEEVMRSSVLHDEVRELVVLDRSIHLDDPWVARDLQVEVELPDVACAAALGFAHALHSVLAVPFAREVDAPEDDAVPAAPEDVDELDGVVVDAGAQGRVGTRWRELRHAKVVGVVLEGVRRHQDKEKKSGVRRRMICRRSDDVFPVAVNQ